MPHSHQTCGGRTSRLNSLPCSQTICSCDQVVGVATVNGQKWQRRVRLHKLRLSKLTGVERNANAIHLPTDVLLNSSSLLFRGPAARKGLFQLATGPTAAHATLARYYS